MNRDKRFKSFLEDIKNTEKSGLDRRRETIEGYIIDINNKLYDLCSFMNLDLQEIRHIHPDKEVRNKKRENEFGDDEKRAIVAAVLADEREDERKEELKKQAMEAADISEEEFSSYLNDDVIKKILTQPAEKESKSSEFKKQAESFNNKSFEDGELKKRYIDAGKGLSPPKTDWERIDVPKDEKEKILQSIRANPKSNIFSKEFKWNPEEFLEAFTYLEESKEYNGPFIVSIIDKKSELEKYYANPFFSDKISRIYLGKYILLSIYDITASHAVSKTINVGLEYMSLDGKLKFDFARSSNRFSISNSQRTLLKELFETMDIEYDSRHEDLIPLKF